MDMSKRVITAVAVLVTAVGGYTLPAYAEQSGNGSFCDPPRISCSGFDGWQACFNAGYGTDWTCSDTFPGNAGCGGAIMVNCSGLVL